MIKAAFIDFDGTIYSHFTESIPSSAVQAINALHDKGIKVYLCSGRDISEMAWFDISMLKLDGFIYANGQRIMNERCETIHEKIVEGKLRELIIEAYDSHALPVYIVTEEGIFLNYVDDTVREVQAAVSSNIPPVAPYTGEKIFMASYFTKDLHHPLIEALRDLSEITYWHAGACDIMPKGIGKTQGIDFILEKEGIDLSETLAIGDGENDVGMIRHCAIGIAMGNSPQEVKKAADHVTGHIDEDGLAQALKYYSLI